MGEVLLLPSIHFSTVHFSSSPALMNNTYEYSLLVWCTYSVTGVSYQTIKEVVFVSGNFYEFNRFVILFSRMSTRVLLATLSIPITPERTDIARLLDMDGIIVEKQRRLATLLGLQAPPTRIGLINDMVGISWSIFIAQNKKLYGHVL